MLIFFALLFFAVEAMAGIGPDVAYTDGKLEVNAQDAPLIPLLESLARAAGIEIFVSDELEPVTVSASFTNMKMEDGLRSVLKGLNYAFVYSKKGDSWPVSSIYIYPANKQSGKLVHVKPAKGVSFQDAPSEGHRIMMVDQYGERMFMGTDEGGILAPSRSTSKLSDESIPAEVEKPWFKMQYQLERGESAKYQDLLLMRKRLEAVSDPDKKEALSLAYADELADFHRMKVANLNKIESMKRIYQNREMNK